MNEKFVHLHLHTEYSLLDGMMKIKDLAARAKEMGFKSMAITDHGNMFGVADFCYAMKGAGIKPIVGCEMYIIPDGMMYKKRDNRHIVLLAKNEIGYANLATLASIGSIDGFYYDARIDHETLIKYSEGLIALSACLGGDVAREIKNNLRYDIEEGPESLDSWDSGYAAGLERALFYKGIFGEDYYLEIQDNGIKEQYLLNEQLIRMSKEAGIKLVVTNDAHYLTRDLYASHDVYMAMGSGVDVKNAKRKHYESDEFYLKGYEAFVNDNIPIEAIENTLEIADKCTFQMEFGVYKIPAFPDVPEGETGFSYLDKIALEGLKYRYPDTWEDNLERLKFEIGVARNMGFNDYFLIAWDFVDYARKMGFFYGPGRGSAGGSVLAYSLRITHIDPIKYKLIFERFLNPARISAADIDWDIDDVNRPAMIRYIEDKYGKDHVAQIITFIRMAAKKAVKDTARTLGYPVEMGDMISKAIPDIIGIKLKEAIEISEDLKRMLEESSDVREIIKHAIAFEGLPSSPSTHAAGVVISPFPIAGKLPLWKTREKNTSGDKSKKKSSIVVQSEMSILEKQGYLKMDFLGLSTLTVIGKCIKAIEENHGIVIDYEELLNGSGNTPETYKIIAEGDTEGLFQIEGNAMTRVAKDMAVQNFEELTALISLYRPGPMDSIPDYIENKKNPDRIKVPFEALREILAETFGILAYQEQVMEMVQKIAGYSMSEADDVRKAIGKKIEEAMERHGKIFADKGAARYGYDVLFNYWKGTIIPFGRYAFNKSHGCGYARLCEMTAYLKAFFPVEFMASTIEVAFSKSMDNKKKEIVMSMYFEYLKKKSIPILQPNINRNSSDFIATKEGAVMYGLSSIKGVGDCIDGIIKNRTDYGPFVDFADLVNRTANLPNVTRSTYEALIYSGACDCLGVSRSSALATMDKFLWRIKQRKASVDRDNVDTKYPFLEKDIIPLLLEVPKNALLKKEREYCSTYISGHPLQAFRTLLDVSQTISFAEVLPSEDSDTEYTLYKGLYRGIVMIEGLKEVYTKKDKKLMAMTTVTDGTASISMPIFNPLYMTVKEGIHIGDVIMLDGRFDSRDGEINILPKEMTVLKVEDIPGETFFIISDEEELLKFQHAMKGLQMGKYPVYVRMRDFVVSFPSQYWPNKEGIAFLKKRFKNYSER